MAFKYVDRVKDTTTTTGTGAITLSGTAAPGFQAFSPSYSVGDTFAYTIQDDANWEVGIGTLTSATTFARTTVIDSSNSKALVSFAAGSKDVFVTLPSWEVVPSNTPTSSPAGTVQLFSRAIASRPMLAQVGSFGIDTALQPLLARNKVGYWNPSGNSTGIPGVFGMFAPTVIAPGTLARNVATTNLATRMRRTGMVSSTTAAATGGAYTTAAQFSAGSGNANDSSGFLYVCRFVPSNASAVSGERMFVGMSSSITAPTNVEPSTLTNSIGIAQLSTDATQLYLVYGGSAAQTPIALGSTNFPGGTLSTTAFEIAIFAPASVANTFYVQVTNLSNGGTYTTTFSGGATVVPQSTTLLNWRIWKSNNTVAAAVGIDLCSVYIETDA